MIKANSNSFQSVESYCRCCVCGRVFPQSAQRGAAIGTKMSCCGADEPAREQWPQPAVLKLLEVVTQQDTDSAEKLQFDAMLLCSAVEMIIEGILIGYLKATSALARPDELTFKNGRGVENLIRVYEEISGASMQDKFESLGAGDFMSDLRRLVSLRNELACNKDYAAKQAERSSVLSVRDWCLKYFSLLNNNLCQGVTRKKAVAKSEGKKKKSVLVVDDELVVLDFMCKIIKRHGLDYFGAATGMEGIRLFKENVPDCVLLDVALPDIDGLKVLKTIKEIDPSAVVHMVTGIGGEAIEKAAIRLGTTGYLLKPVDPGIVINIIKNI